MNAAFSPRVPYAMDFGILLNHQITLNCKCQLRDEFSLLCNCQNSLISLLKRRKSLRVSYEEIRYAFSSIIGDNVITYSFFC